MFIQKMLINGQSQASLYMEPDIILTAGTSTKLALDINRIYKIHNVYEYVHNGKAEPLINPTVEQIQNPKKHIHPLTEKRKQFLDKFVNYLIESGPIKISKIE